MKRSAILDIKQFDQPEVLSDFYVSTFSEHLTKNHHAISVPHKHNFYVTVLFTEGTGFHEIDFERFDVQRGSLFFLNPGQTHHWVLSENIEGYIFFHSETFYNFHFSQNSLSAYPFFYSTQNSPHLLLNEKTTQETEKRFQTLLDEYLADELYKFRKINNLIDGMYIDFSRIYLSENTEVIHKANGYSEKLKQLETLIDLHFREEKSPAQYAEWMNMSAKHLNRIIRESTGKTTTILITERVILEAKRLLSHSPQNMTEIAEFLGYSEYAYFSRMFRKNTGETPSEFKSKYTVL